MVKNIIFIFIILAALIYSFYPTIYELSLSNNLKDKNREFILEHNYYWPDFNLYLSKIRQGTEGKLTALERYTSESHQGSFIQIFYVYLGQLGRLFGLDPNGSYQLGRIIFSPLLLIMVVLLVRFYFRSFTWQIVALLIVIISGSFPHFYTDNGSLQIGRFMEWWSNIDAVQRLTFIPHILFGQVVSFFLLYQLTTHHSPKKMIFYILLGNLVGIVFPPSLITLDGVLLLTLLTKYIRSKLRVQRLEPSVEFKVFNFNLGFALCTLRFALFIFLTLPSLLYLLIITQQTPWSALVEFHRTHPMMIPFWDYILGTGPIFFLGIWGAVVSVFRHDYKYQPLIFWILTTFLFAILFTYVREQSPLRFTQTGLFIPLGILGSYLFYQLYQIKPIRLISLIGITLYILGNLYMLTVSLKWQTSFISQRVRASIPPVPYPPQTMYPLKEWMEAIRWLKNNTERSEVVLAAITAGNFIPAYSGNTVYFGQSNTVDYNRKQSELEQFFKGHMSASTAELFLKNNRIKYIFYSIQERELSGGKNLEFFYPYSIPVFTNSLVTIYKSY